MPLKEFFVRVEIEVKPCHLALEQPALTVNVEEGQPIPLQDTASPYCPYRFRIKSVGDNHPHELFQVDQPTFNSWQYANLPSLTVVDENCLLGKSTMITVTLEKLDDLVHNEELRLTINSTKPAASPCEYEITCAEVLDNVLAAIAFEQEQQQTGQQ